MSWIVVGAAAVGAAGTIGGALLSRSGGGGGGGGGGGVPIKKLEQIAKANARRIQASAYGTIPKGNLKTRGKGKNKRFVVTVGKGKDKKVIFRSDRRKKAQQFIDKRKGKPKAAPALIPTVTKLSNNFVNKVDKEVARGKKQLNTEEKDLLKRLKRHDATLSKAQNREDALLQEDLSEITSDFKAGINLLNEQDRQEFETALASFDERAQAETAAYDARASDIAEDADAESLEVIEDFESDSMALGDRFLEATDAARSGFDSDFADSLDLSPERLSIFSQAADFLSQAAVDTRAKMLATADPRALELSAIADENAAAMMSGRIGADVQANLARSSAMRALQGGFGASSEMGRGLAARDLGLASLQLQQQGIQDYDRQRRLNYDTRVAGLQTSAGALLAEDSRARQQQALTNYEAALNTATSDRDQRQNVFGTALTGNLARIDNRAGRDLGIAGSVFQSGLESNRIGFDATRNNIGDRTVRGSNTLTNVFDRNFVSRQGVYDQNLNTDRSIYTTNANAAGNIFNTRANAIYQDTSARIAARDKAVGNKIAVRTGVFDAINAANAQGAATVADATMQNWASKDAWKASQVSSNNALWGSAISSASSVFGNLVGSVFEPRASTGYTSLGMAQQAAPYTTNFSNIPGMGYVPQATAV